MDVRRVCAAPGTEPDVAARFGLQHEGKVLAAHLRRWVDLDICGANDRSGRHDRMLRFRFAVDQRRIAALITNGRAHVERRRDPANDATDALLDQVLDFALEGAHRAAQHDLLRNDVPGVAAVHLRHADHSGVLRVKIARDDRLQRIDRLRYEKHRVLARIGHRRVRALAGGDDFEDVVRAHQRSRAHRERTGRQARPVVHAVDRAHREALEQPFLDHHPASAFVLLGRLKDEVDRAVQTLPLRQRPGGA